jgi:hypothetical protein
LKSSSSFNKENRANVGSKLGGKLGGKQQQQQQQQHLITINLTTHYIVNTGKLGGGSRLGGGGLGSKLARPATSALFDE